MKHRKRNRKFGNKTKPDVQKGATILIKAGKQSYQLTKEEAVELYYALTAVLPLNLSTTVISPQNIATNSTQFPTYVSYSQGPINFTNRT